jgi:hypothetical protein
MRLRGRVDGNQVEIVRALRAVGCSVRCTHQLGQGFPDLLVRTRRRILKQIEVKMPGEKLTPDEMEYARLFPETVIVRSVDEALQVVGVTVIP